MSLERWFSHKMALYLFKAAQRKEKTKARNRGGLTLFRAFRKIGRKWVYFILCMGVDLKGKTTGCGARDGVFASGKTYRRLGVQEAEPLPQ